MVSHKMIPSLYLAFVSSLEDSWLSCETEDSEPLLAPQQ